MPGKRISQKTWVETVTQRGPEPILAHQIGVLDFLQRRATSGHAGRVLWGLAGQSETVDATDMAPLQLFTGAVPPGGSRRPIAATTTALPSAEGQPAFNSLAATAARIGAG